MVWLLTSAIAKQPVQPFNTGTSPQTTNNANPNLAWRVPIDELTTDEQCMAEARWRVLEAGGETDAPLCVSLLWDDESDLDLSILYLANGAVKSISAQAWSEHGGYDLNSLGGREEPHPCEHLYVNDPPDVGTYAVIVDLVEYCGMTPSKQNSTSFVLAITTESGTDIIHGEASPYHRMKPVHHFTYKAPTQTEAYESIESPFEPDW